MEGIIPWQELLWLIEPHYPKTGQRGRQPMALRSMFRIYCLQNWFNLSDRQMEDALYEIESMRRFAGFSGVTDGLPDETTILNFRHLLEKHELTALLLDANKRKTPAGRAQRRLLLYPDYSLYFLYCGWNLFAEKSATVFPAKSAELRHR